MKRSLSERLDHPVYHQAVKLRGYNNKVCIFQAASNRDAGRILCRLKPDWTPMDHLLLSKKHADEAKLQQEQWEKLVEEACQETFGRSFDILDYIISGIAREEFSEEKKEKLRFASHATTYHDLASRAHASAARQQRYRVGISLLEK